MTDAAESNCFSLEGVPESDRLYFRQLLSGRDFAVYDPMAAQMRNFAYLIGDRQTGDAVVVDPAYAAGDLLDALEADGMHLSGVLVTHHHPDHVGGKMMGFELKGLAELLERVSVPVHVNAHEAQWVSRVTEIPMTDLTAHDHGDRVSVGDIDIELLHTPGHTPGSQCFLLDGRLVMRRHVVPGWLRPNRLPGRGLRRDVPQPAAVGGTAGRPDGVPRSLVFGRHERGAFRSQAVQLCIQRRKPGPVAHADGRMRG